MKFVHTETGMIARDSLYDPGHPWDLKSVREAVAQGGLYEAIGLFSIIYDGFGPKFETFVRDDQAKRDSGEPVRAEPEMAEWCQMLAEAAEHYTQALLSGCH